MVYGVWCYSSQVIERQEETRRDMIRKRQGKIRLDKAFGGESEQNKGYNKG